MKNITLLIIIFTWSFSATAQVQLEQPNTYFLSNSRLIVVDNNQSGTAKRKFKIKAIYKGEPAMLPVYLYTYIQCGREAFKAVDLVGPLLSTQRNHYSHYIGAPTKDFPRGVFHVCGLENIKMDNERVFVSVYKEGSETCNTAEVIDFIFPLAELCN